MRFSILRPAISSFCKGLVSRSLIETCYPSTLLTDDFLNNFPPVVYAGFDPTAQSLHVGNLVVLNALIRSASLDGCRAIALVGGATALVGDPSGKKSDRNELAMDVVAQNTQKLHDQLSRIFANAGTTDFAIVNNLEWFENMSMIDFLRMARKFRVGPMLRLGHIKNRMRTDIQAGVNFTEFSYQILQSYDWLVLANKFDCRFQIGGSDQLGHLDAGSHYVQAVTGQRTGGVCLPLVTDAFGEKIGKSTAANGDGVWLDPGLTSPYAFYQYFRQLHDNTAAKLFPMFSLRPLEEIDAVIREHEASIGKSVAQTALAEEMTRLVHGPQGLATAQQCSNVLFKGSLKDFQSLDSPTIASLFGEASTFDVPRGSTTTFGSLADQTRRDKNKGSVLMTKGAFRVNGVRHTDPTEPLDSSSTFLVDGLSLISWGKRKFFLVRWI